MLTAWVCFPMTCVTIVTKISLSSEDFTLLWAPRSAEQHNVSVSFGVHVIRRTDLTVATTIPAIITPVSYTHLTLPTILLV